MVTDNSHSLALAEARLVTAKLLWHFDLELDGPHENWVQGMIEKQTSCCVRDVG
jgi:hypothetical protein